MANINGTTGLKALNINLKKYQNFYFWCFALIFLINLVRERVDGGRKYWFHRQFCSDCHSTVCCVCVYKSEHNLQNIPANTDFYKHPNQHPFLFIKVKSLTIFPNGNLISTKFEVSNLKFQKCWFSILWKFCDFIYQN